jgi:uncharacterized protein
LTAIHDTLAISAEHGSVSTLLSIPARARAILVLAHGAGAAMNHATMNAIADALGERTVATFRFNFPFMEHGRSRTDSRGVATLAIARAVHSARVHVPNVPMLIGGHSFGGRMASHAVLEHDLGDVRGLVFCSFPLHPAGNSDTSRAAHLPQIPLPMLFLSGTRDALATPSLLNDVVGQLGSRATLVWLDTADHGYRVLKRKRKAGVSVFEEMADAVDRFVGSLSPR